MRAAIATLFSLVLLTSAAAAQTKLPDVPFVGELIRLRQTTVELLKILHRHAHPKDKAALARFDDQYDFLKASVNGLLESVARDVEFNTPHDSDWKKSADDIIAQAQQFQLALRGTQADPRRQAALYRGGMGGQLNFEWNPKEKSVLLKYEVDFSKAHEDATNLKLKELEAQLQSQQKAAQVAADERKAFAADLLAQQWPNRCAVGLEKPACAPQSKL